jgi:hypothetical protein
MPSISGIWGDLHILSCDGLRYDCNAIRLFTLMKNFLCVIQGRFVHVGSLEIKAVLGWEKNPTATYTNDIVIQNVENTDVPFPVMQFSFREFFNE